MSLVLRPKMVRFLGHVISSEGISPDPEKVKVISEMRPPTCKKEARRFYVNDLFVKNFNVVKYADDTTFYRTVKDPTTDSVAPAILQTQLWFENNKMILNAEKSVIINVSLNHCAV